MFLTIKFVKQQSNQMQRIYLDNAATSWPKPESVYAAVDYALRALGAPAGRGGYRQVVEVQRMIEQTRGLIAELINAPVRNSIAFTFNCTDSLSTALFGLLKPGDHVVTTVVEHNSVLRPLKHLESTQAIEVTIVGCDPTGLVDADELISAVRADTRLLCLNHISNVTGTIQPVASVKSKLITAGNEQTLFLVDAAQSLGHIPIDVQAMGVDILTASGHKGIMGPLGTGVLYVGENIADQIHPLRYGGTGTDGSLEFQPTTMPDKFEAGNLNVPGIAGVKAGIEFLNCDEGSSAGLRREELAQLFLQGILGIDGVKLQGMPSPENRIGVFSFTIEGLECHEASSILDSNWSVQTRTGLHCAPLIHRALGTESSGGTIRLSLGLFNTGSQIETAIDGIAQLAAM